MEKVNLRHKFELFQEHWQPKIVAEVNDSYVKIAKIQGEFIWHHHEDEDELFFVIKGDLDILLQDGKIHLNEGEFTVIPRGVEHKPVAEEEVHLMLIEPKTTRNTGNVLDKHTAQDAWI